MHGVVSLLGGEHERLVEALWAELARDFGVRGSYVTPFPHFSYQVAAGYDVPAVAAALRRFAARRRAFRVRTSGLGIFTGERPVLYIPVVRTAELSRFHAAFWAALLPAAIGSLDYYAPPTWQPHITLGHGDLDADRVAAILRGWSGRAFTWEIPVDNLALIHDSGSQQELTLRVPLRGSGPHPHHPPGTPPAGCPALRHREGESWRALRLQSPCRFVQPGRLDEL